MTRTSSKNSIDSSQTYLEHYKGKLNRVVKHASLLKKGEINSANENLDVFVFSCKFSDFN